MVLFKMFASDMALRLEGRIPVTRLQKPVDLIYAANATPVVRS